MSDRTFIRETLRVLAGAAVDQFLGRPSIVGGSIYWSIQSVII